MLSNFSSPQWTWERGLGSFFSRFYKVYHCFQLQIPRAFLSQRWIWPIENGSYHGCQKHWWVNMRWFHGGYVSQGYWRLCLSRASLYLSNTHTITKYTYHHKILGANSGYATGCYFIFDHLRLKPLFLLGCITLKSTFHWWHGINNDNACMAEVKEQHRRSASIAIKHTIQMPNLINCIFLANKYGE